LTDIVKSFVLVITFFLRHVGIFSFSKISVEVLKCTTEQ